MKRLLALMTIAPLLLALPTTADGKKKHSRGCAIPGAKLVVTGSEARVLRVVGRDSTNVYACRPGSRKRYLLSSIDAEGGIGDETHDERVAGPVVAYATSQSDDTQRYNPDFRGFVDSVSVLNVKTGTRSRTTSVPGVASGSVHSLVLSGSGGVGWISQGGKATYEVRTLQLGSSTSNLLDSGPDVDPSSLAFGGVWLYWTNKGTPRSVPFR